MKNLIKILILFVALFIFSNYCFADDFEDFEASLKPTQAESLSKAKWIFLLPSFVVHGEQPTNGVYNDMPRKLDPRGRSVATPGFGFEYEGEKSLDVLFAFVKDCYDNYASAMQVRQYFKLNESIKYGYTLGLYVRETPLNCYTQTTGSSNNGGGGTRPGPGSGGPSRTNSFSTTTCEFADNLPFRYTFKSSGQYFDVIPTPFLNVSARLYHGSFDVHLKIMSNYYLNEVGLAIPF